MDKYFNFISVVSLRETPKCIHSEPVNVALFGKGVFADLKKDLKMRSFWITQVGPKCSNKHPEKRRGNNTQRRR